MTNNKNSSEHFGTIEDILKSIDKLDETMLRETLAYIIKVYILDRAVGFEGTVNDVPELPDGIVAPVERASTLCNSFAELISQMKQVYSFPELDIFTIEQSRVTANFEGKKYYLSNNTIGEQRTSDNNKNAAPQKEQDTTSRFKNLEMD